MTKVQEIGIEEVRALADLLTKRFGEVGGSAILVGLRRDIEERGLDGKAALIFVRATRIMYESAKPLRYQEVKHV